MTKLDWYPTKKYSVSGEFGQESIKNEDYVIYDNTYLKNFVVSEVKLFAGKKTYKHIHPGNEEVYLFHSGQGYMMLDGKKIYCNPGDIVSVRDKEHQVFAHPEADMSFTMVYDNRAPDKFKDE